MKEAIKQELHILIDSCDDEILLKEAKSLLESITDKDWWDDLTEEDKSLIRESESQYEQGNYRTHEAVMKDIESWRKK